MDKNTNPDIRPVNSKSPRGAIRRPHVLDIRRPNRATTNKPQSSVGDEGVAITVKKRTATTTTKTDSDTAIRVRVAKTTNSPSSKNSTPANDAPKAEKTTSVPEIVTTAPPPTKSKAKKHFRPDKLARKARRQIDKTTNHILRHGQKFLVQRWDHIRMYRRDVISWLVLVLVLIVGCFIQTISYGNQDTIVAAASGGAYVEGTVDKLTTISPLYASTDTEKAVSQLVYPGLLSYDSDGKLHGELASTWSVDQTGSVWTVSLKPNLTWTDGQSITVDDVVYTVELMKNPDVNSTLSSVWKNIEVATTNTSTITFTLPNPLMSFDTALTFGVLPKHILMNKSPIDIASMFSESPTDIVSSGPFKLASVENLTGYSTWNFTPNEEYYAGQPKLDRLSIRTYADTTSLIDGLKRGEVNAISNISINNLAQFDTTKYKIVQLKTASGVYALFNNDGAITSNQTVRDALRLGLDREAIRNAATNSSPEISPPTKLESPIAVGVYESIDKLSQPDYNLDQAGELLDRAGWILTNGSIYRQKNGQELVIRIVTIAGTNYENVASLVATQWQKLGVNATVEAVDPSQAQQLYLVPRNFDVLVYQMHLGSDPDMYAYWSSTQATESGLNFANYRSRRAEIALTNGRTNPNPTAREARYVAFAEQWLQDNPAIALYQPSFFYVMDNNLQTIQSGKTLVDASNRFQNASTWTVKTKRVMITP